ncbi:ASCH domain-containing protein [Alteromonas sp. ASW11-19]|uniref:ASCH domain-containing protein n=1 Tax=Alteromonas salexigens TaxID=2982530 RepID=A0ABT2VJ27_9ALTE|nr:ASCH domain-containing protein [Alteromonas salexigens]MCU7553197.1 ASCH domain-containing protein [Alteromonas salexigens]
MSNAYFQASAQPARPLTYWHFCDNEHDANECAELVLRNIKQATSPSLWWHQAHNEPLPEVGELNVVTNWQGEAVCIIETTQVSIVPFNEISDEYAALEGEGDKSLTYWKQVHWDYYHRELTGTAFAPQHDMPIVCHQFTVVFKDPSLSVG